MKQRLAGSLSRRKMKIGDLADHPAVDLFGKWGVFVLGAQPGLDVANLYMLVISGQRPAQRRGGIALHQHHGGLFLGDYAVQALDGAGSHLGQALPGLHDIQVDVGLDAEHAHRLIEHLAVLAGETHPGGEQVLPPVEFHDHRGQFNRFGPSAHYNEDLIFHASNYLDKNLPTARRYVQY